MIHRKALDISGAADLLSGQLDVVSPNLVQDIPRLEAAANAGVLTDRKCAPCVCPGAGLNGVNPLKNRRVGETIYRAVDANAIREKILRSQAAPAALMVTPTSKATRTRSSVTTVIPPGPWLAVVFAMPIVPAMSWMQARDAVAKMATARKAMPDR